MSKLSPNLIVDSYKVLCFLLGVEPKSGDAKNAQLKEFERFFKFEKMAGTWRIRILEVYEKPKSKHDGRSAGNNSKYTHLVEQVLLSMLRHAPHEMMITTANRLCHSLGLTNERFQNEYRTLVHVGVPPQIKADGRTLESQVVQAFLIEASTKSKEIVQTTLGRMVRQGNISCWQGYTLHNAKSQSRRERLSTPAEAASIETVHRQALAEFGSRSMYDVMRKGKSAAYYRRVNGVLAEQYGWFDVFPVYQIKLCDSDGDPPPTMEEQAVRQELNRLFCDYFIEAAKRKVNKPEHSENTPPHKMTLDIDPDDEDEPPPPSEMPTRDITGDLVNIRTALVSYFLRFDDETFG